MDINYEFRTVTKFVIFNGINGSRRNCAYVYSFVSIPNFVWSTICRYQTKKLLTNFTLPACIMLHCVITSL